MSLPLCGAPRLLLRGWWHRPRLCCLLLWSETHSTKETFHDPAIPVTCAYCDHFQSALFKAQWFTCGHVIAFSPNKLIKKIISEVKEILKSHPIHKQNPAQTHRPVTAWEEIVAYKCFNKQLMISKLLPFSFFMISKYSPDCLLWDPRRRELEEQ